LTRSYHFDYKNEIRTFYSAESYN